MCDIADTETTAQEAFERSIEHLRGLGLIEVREVGEDGDVTATDPQQP
jgi:hypothetical protein